MSKQKTSRPWLILGLVLLSGTGLYFLAHGLGWIGGSETKAIEGAPVRRGPLKISVVERGNLTAANSVSLKSEVEGTTTILSLIEEGTQVQPGDVLCELDATRTEESRVQQEITVKNAEAAFVKAQQNLDIQRSQNDSDIAASLSQLDFAQRDLRKYLEGDWPQEEQSAKDDIVLAQEELKRAQDRLEWSKKLSENGFLTRTELEADELSLQRGEIRLQQTKRALEVLQNFDRPREEARLKADVAEAERELSRVRLQAAARTVDAEAALSTSQDKYGLEKSRLEKITDQIRKSRIIAPVAGMVVYSQGEGGGGRMGGNSDPIAEGTSVRERQEILTIPASDGGMIAEASLHESVLEQVQVGQNVLITVDALPGRSFEGKVSYKAVLPDKNSWWANPNLRLYRTEIEVPRTDSAMRPGMSCSIEVLVSEIESTLYVPVQAIFLDKGETVCFVDSQLGYALVPVEAGQHSSKWVEIKSGLSEGQVVLLSQPPGSSLQPALSEPESDGPAQAAGSEGKGLSGQGGRAAPAAKLPSGADKPAGAAGAAAEGKQWKAGEAFQGGAAPGKDTAGGAPKGAASKDHGTNGAGQ